MYVPGIDATGALLLGTAARLERHFRLLRLRHVAKDATDDDRYETIADSIVEILDAAQIDDAMLLAESFGGAVALQCALDHPRRIRALAIVNSFAWMPKRFALALSRLGAPLLPRTMFEYFRPRIAPWSLFGHRREDDALRRFREHHGTWFDYAYRRRLTMIRSLDLRPRLHEIEQPVALFASDMDRVVPSVTCARTMQQSLRNVTLEIVEGGGHLILPLESIPWVDKLRQLDARVTGRNP